MKYIVLLCDGMSDLPFDGLNGKTPMQVAKKPNMDKLARVSEIGLVKTVAQDMKPGSDVANLAVLGYNPKDCYTGRSPLEAASLGIDMAADDVSFRCNLVTLSDEGESYENKRMVDYCGGDITTEEAKQLIEAVQERFGNSDFHFYPGVQYRHCLIWHKGTTAIGKLTPPHDISDRIITDHLGVNEAGAALLAMMKASFDLLNNHPVNLARKAKGLRPANSIWLWGEGKRTALQPFAEMTGLPNFKGAMISAVDLLRGIGKLAGMTVIEVPGATAWIDTNFEGKAQAAVDFLHNGGDYAYVHIEAPDECGHRGEAANKVRAIELIDERALGLLLNAMQGEDFRLLICPDHPTPLSTKTHTHDPVPFLIYDSRRDLADREADFCSDFAFTEETAKHAGLFIPNGYELIKRLLDN
jgi:2,3-bisphosphoglycerate-independent phosphoglycerate mutase